MLLSVIIPVYNAGDYLLPCVKSVLTLPIDKEIIVVDDGSTDGSVDKLLQSLGHTDGLRNSEADGLSGSQSNYHRNSETDGQNGDSFSLIRQTNSGVSVARNKGLLQAKGDWVWFVDADDTIDAAHTETLYIRDTDQLLLLPYSWEQEGTVTDYTPRDGEVPFNLWRCWFRRDIIMQHDLRFTTGRRYAEDQAFILHYLLASSCRTRAVSAPKYQYVMRSTGVMLRPGTRQMQRHDVTAVLRGFVKQALLSGQWTQGWVWKEIKRLLKTISVI